MQRRSGMKYAMIERPSAGTLGIIARKAPDRRLQAAIAEGAVEAVGICQGTVTEVLVASDIAEKTAGVVAGELNGTCPNHITCLVMLGDSSGVKAAMEGVKAACGARISGGAPA